jgi:hypothetical protein
MALHTPAPVVSAGASCAPISTLLFSNANGVSFGLNNQTLTASVAPGGGGLTNIKVSAGVASDLRSDLTFDNANGLSFGLAGGVITGSYTVPIVGVQFNFVGGGGIAGAMFNFNNVNGVSFGYDTLGSSISASVQTNYAGVGESVSTVAGTDLGLTVNTDGVSILHPNWLTAAPAQTVQPVAVEGSNGSYLFSTLKLITGNGASFYTDASGVRVSYTVPNVPAQSVQPVAASGSNGSFAFSTLQFVTGNGASFYTDATGIRLTYTVPNVPAQTDQTLGLYMSSNTTSSTSSGTADARSMSFRGMGIASVGYSGGEVVISVPSGGGQTVQPVAASGSNGSFLFSTLQFVTGNGATFVTDATGIRLSYTVPAATVFSNSNNVSFGLNGSTITASVTVAATAQTVQPVAASGSNGSFAFSTLQFVTGNGASFYTDATGIRLSYTVPSQSAQPVAASGSNGSFA